MKAFAKTLFGDARNVIGVGAVVALAAGLTTVGHAGWAVVVVPLSVLCTAAWLARH